MSEDLKTFIKENSCNIYELIKWLEYDEIYKNKLNPFYGYNYADTVSERIKEIKNLIPNTINTI